MLFIYLFYLCRNYYRHVSAHERLRSTNQKIVCATYLGKDDWTRPEREASQSSSSLTFSNPIREIFCWVACFTNPWHM